MKTSLKLTLDHILNLLLMLIFLGTLSACGGGGSTQPAPIMPPTALTYSPNPVVCNVGTAISNLTPTHAGGTATSYSVTPTLPDGISINASTGVISGTPSTITPGSNYTITVRNSAGSSIFILNITVNDAPPFNLTYPLNPLIIIHGVVTGNSFGPVNGGGIITNYSVSPALPIGLNLNPTTGVIGGTPTTITPSASYTFIGTNSGGSTSETIVIEII